MSTLVTLVCPLFIFALGILVGNGYTTRAQDVRDRRQAAVQRSLNAQYQALRQRQEADEEDLRWFSKQQAGMTVIDYEVTNEIPRRARPARSQ